MSKKTLLAATAIGAIALAGAASAHELSFRTQVGANIIDAADVEAAGSSTAADDAEYGVDAIEGVYLIAAESTAATLGTSGTLALWDDLSGGTTLPSGNALYTISLTNATFGTAVTAANVVGQDTTGGDAPANCNVALSTGGLATDSEVTFIVSSSGSCGGFDLNVPVRPNGAGNTISVSTNIRTEALNPIDGGIDTIPAILAINAFRAVVNGDINDGVGVDDEWADVDTRTTIISTGLVGGGTDNPALAYDTLAGDTILGGVAVYVDTRAHRSLNPDGVGANVSTADVSTVDVTVTGNFTAFNGATAAADPQLEGVDATTTSNTQTFFDNVQAVTVYDLTAFPGSYADFAVIPNGQQIPTSPYTASVVYDLVAAFNDEGAVSGSFESIERDGANFIAPWVGGSQASSKTVIRLSSTNGTPSGAVTLRLFNALDSDGAIPDDTCSASDGLGIVPGGGDYVINQATLASCFGDFVRGDLEITVEADPASMTAKMRTTAASGTYETTLGRYSGSGPVNTDRNAAF